MVTRRVASPFRTILRAPGMQRLLAVAACYIVVLQALLAYVALGVTTLLIRGYDPLDDAVDYGRELIPLVRAEVARRDRAAA